MTATTPQRPGSTAATENQIWRAPAATGPVHGRVTMPGSKSATNRALLLSALTSGTSVLVEPLEARDTVLMAEALRRLGAEVTPDPTGGKRWNVTGRSEPAPVGDITVDCGNAGTVARFLPPAAAVLARGAVTVDGDARMRERPLQPLLDALRTLGAQLPPDARHVPFTLLATGGLRGGNLEVDASSSSQLISGLLLAAPRYDDGLTVTARGRVPSAPHLAMTIAMLRTAGADVDDSVPGCWAVRSGALTPAEYVIEPDLSSASAFLAAAAVTGGTVRLANWPAATTQPGRLLPELFAASGCQCAIIGGDLVVTGPAELTGVDLDLTEYGEVVPTLTAVAAVAATTGASSRLRGVAHLRGQETDRLAALAEELGRLGARIDITEDGLAIAPAKLAAPEGVVLDPRADHRLAMAYAVVGLVVDGVAVSDIATTGKTVPDFPDRWARLLAGAS